ncbi:hypothetical protein FOL47_006905 [Perkinsus chesapeaki]|uniref:AB hydrolase-1 domain-containing protein n=1 Tax=Perkinsus chesapeaki TaxID=330153 RepID=A0A7J6LNR0_PERCH|nr:hypothetical protein FOL47_006905 [Perkinsus chesapeaki]
MNHQRSDRLEDRGGGEVFSVISEPSEEAVLSSEAFNEKEKSFLLDNLTTQVAEFSISANCQIYARCLQQSTGIKPTKHKLSKKKGADTGEWVLAIHGYGNLTTSWTWMKLALSLYKKGFNVLLIDLPGFGKSNISQNIRCPPERWRPWEASMISHVLSEFGVHQCRVVACYEGAGMLFKLLMKYPNLIGTHHILYNPIIDDDALESYCSPLRLTSKIRSLGNGFNVWVASDRNSYGGIARRDVQKITEKTFQMLTKISEDNLCKERVIIAKVTRQDIAEMQAYKSDEPGLSSLRILYPSKYFRVYATEFISGSRLPPYAPVMAAPGGLRWALVAGKEEPGLDELPRRQTRDDALQAGRILHRYLEEYADEEANFQDALAESHITAENERLDPRLTELRSMPEVDHIAQLREMQGSIEDSINTYELYHALSEDEQMKMAIANSLKENLPIRRDERSSTSSAKRGDDAGLAESLDMDRKEEDIAVYDAIRESLSTTSQPD